MAIVSLTVTYLLAGVLGWGVSRRMKGMPGKSGWVLLVLAAILAQWVLPGTRLIDVFQFKLYANHLLQGFLAGVIVGLQMRGSARHFAGSSETGVRPA